MSNRKTTDKTFDLTNVLPKKVPTKHKPHNLLSKEQLEEIEERKKREVIFSWRFFDRSHKYFNMGNTDSPWFISLLDCLQDVSRLTVEEFRQQSERRGLRVHPHDWRRASAKFNLPEESFEQYKENCLQFSISKANGRVHGILIDNVFYIVWLDPLYNLYPPKERNRKVLEYDYPVTEYEVLELEVDSLEKEIESLKEDISTYEQLLDDID
jgi:hypothetical protein